MGKLREVDLPSNFLVSLRLFYAQMSVLLQFLTRPLTLEIINISASEIVSQKWSILLVQVNTNLVLSDSGATLKFKFCTLKNTTHTDFQLKISTPGILGAIRSSGKSL